MSSSATSSSPSRTSRSAPSSRSTKWTARPSSRTTAASRRNSSGSGSSTQTSISPPQGSPTLSARSSEIPYVSRRGSPPASTSRAASTTSLSTQPPETEPASSPVSETISFDPIGRGADRRVATTRATAIRSPRARQRSSSERISFTGEIVAPGLMAAADGFAERGTLELETAACAKWRCDAGPLEQRSHQGGPEDHVRNKHLAAHTPRIGPKAARV